MKSNKDCSQEAEKVSAGISKRMDLAIRMLITWKNILEETIIQIKSNKPHWCFKMLTNIHDYKKDDSLSFAISKRNGLWRRYAQKHIIQKWGGDALLQGNRDP